MQQPTGDNNTESNKWVTSKSDIEEFATYIKTIGRGKNTGSTLSQEQAYRAMHLLLNKKIAPEQEGAFLMLLRVREETVDEIAGFTQASRESTEPQYANIQVDLDVSAYAGKRRQLPWFLLALATLAQTGVRIFLHGTQEPHSKRLYAKSALTQLGVTICHDAVSLNSQLDRVGFAYIDLACLNPKLDRLIQLREIFGLRSCANTLARLLNPTGAAYSFQGVHHRHVDLKHMHVSAQLQDANSLCMRGEGGDPEHNPANNTQLCIARSGVSEQIMIPAESTWQLKDTNLALEDMQKLFDGSKVHAYGESAVISTLSDMLLLMHNIPPSEAKEAALALWTQRDKQVLLN